MQRRKFLKSTLLAGGAAALGSCEDKTALNRDRKFSGQVAIIGAGAAGLYAGFLLEQAGITSYTIFEASDRVGGRIRPLKGLADFDIELGAEEIHGKNSVWYDWAKESGATFLNTNTNDYFQIGSQLRTESQLNADADFRAAFALNTQARNYSGTDVNLVQYMDNNRLPARARHVLEAQVANEQGAAPVKLSMRGITEEDQSWSAGDDNYGMANRSFLAIIEEKCKNVIPKVKLNTAIKRIDYGSTERIILEDGQGQKTLFDKVIVTVPLTILQANDIQFTPALPSDKLKAISSIGMGAGMKVILAFNRRFWAADTGSIITAGSVPEFWVSSLGRSTQSFVLTGFVMGTKAEALSSLTSTVVYQTLLRELDGLYGNGVASGAFTNGRVMDWSKEPFIKGAYSYPIVGGGGLLTRQSLSAPVMRKLYFAGEATHYGGHSGTVHGAMESSKRALEELFRDTE